MASVTAPASPVDLLMPAAPPPLPLQAFCDLEAIYTYEGTYEVNALVAGRAITGLSAIRGAAGGGAGGRAGGRAGGKEAARRKALDGEQA